LIHVPLIVVWPQGDQAGRRVSELTSTRDLGPAIAELVANAACARSIFLPPRERIEIADGSARGIRTRDWYLLTDPSGTRLFVKPDDRWEVNDVASQHEDVIAALSEPGAE
jgi:hypothetical protein